MTTTTDSILCENPFSRYMGDNPHRQYHEINMQPTPTYTEDDVREIVMDAIVRSLRAIQGRSYMTSDIAERIEDEIADLLEQAR